MNVTEAVAVAITHTTGVNTTPAPASQSLTDSNASFTSMFGTVPGYTENNMGK